MSMKTKDRVGKHEKEGGLGATRRVALTNEELFQDKRPSERLACPRAKQQN
jgi:hypothetical protein